MKKALLSSLILASSVCGTAYADTEYSLAITEQSAIHHLGDVTVKFDKTNQSYIDAKLPAWRTGRYNILNLANGVRRFEAQSEDGEALKWEKVDKSTWRVYLDGPTEVTLSYQVYANELGLRARHIDDSHAYIDASGFFMFNEAQRSEAVTVQLEVPQEWRSVSGMDNGDNSHQFVAANYDVLVDSPIETGINELHKFEVEGRDYELVIWGEGNYDSKQMVKDLSTLVGSYKAVWDDVPYERYVFMVHATSGARGATEHMNSTIIQRQRDKYAKREDYLAFLSTAAHEFVHTWNVKAYRPEGLVPYDYVEPNYSRLLWLAEGSTSYLEDHLLLRTDIMKKEEFFKDLGKRINRFLVKPGKETQSVAQTSFDSWINQGGDHNHNFSTNIYAEGSLVSMALDIKLLDESEGKVSYRDVHRELYNRHADETRFNDEDVLTILRDISGNDYQSWWNTNIEGPLDIDFDSLLAKVGLQLTYPEDAKKIATLNVKHDLDHGLAKLTYVYRDGVAWNAGLDAGDTIVAINGRRISTDLATLLAQYKPDDKVTIDFFRDDKLRQLELTLGSEYDKPAKVTAVEQPSERQKMMFKQWVGIEL